MGPRPSLCSSGALGCLSSYLRDAITFVDIEGLEHQVYTHGHHESVLRSHRWRTVKNSAAYLIPHLRPGLSLLDVGCGPGTITADFAARLAPGRVCGIDSAADVVAAAQRDHAGIEFATGDVYAMA